MATISSSTFLDGGVARTSGEAFTITTGATLTIRTDTRVHANAPATMTGSVGAITVTEGECFIDATAVRWMPYNTGTGNVPAIGTSITHGGVSGYLLGVWATMVSAPTAVGAAMPAAGFIKFREVTGGAFAAGALTGIGASATSPDVAGWIEVVLQDAVDITVPRLGKFKTRGSRFYLDNTNGTGAQVIATPINGGGANTRVPAIWIETAPASDIFEQYPALNGLNNGWNEKHIGAAEGQSDFRHKFVKMLASGQMQIGETVTYASTYASLAAQASTYADWNVTGTYTVVGNLCTVFCSGGHGLNADETIGFDFTTGAATDTTAQVTVLDAYNLTAPITTANTSGNVTLRLGAVVTFAAHGLAEGNQVYLTVSTGTLPSNTYTVHSIAATGSYNVLFPHTTALTSGSASALHTLIITRTAHGHSIGNEVYLDFTSGGAADGVYTLRATAANTYNVNYAHTAAIAASNVTERFDIGFVPPSGCRTYIPNIIARSGTGATNTVPHATVGSRPEFTTTSAGAIDLEDCYTTWYLQFAQAYSVRMVNCAVLDLLVISECATALTIDNTVVGHYAGGSNTPISLLSNFAGGTISNSSFFRQGATAGAARAVSLIYCADFTFNSVKAGILLYTRGSAPGFYLSNSSNITLNDCFTANGFVDIATTTSSVNNLRYADRLSGKTNSILGLNAVVISVKSTATVDGISWEENQHPFTAAVFTTASSVKVRNIGSIASPVSGGSWEPTIYAMLYLVYTGGNNANCKYQRCFANRLRGFSFTTLNSDKGIVIETVRVTDPYYHSVAAAGSRIAVLVDAFLNSAIKGLSGVQSLTGQASVYGSHWHSIFKGPTLCTIAICFNEPTTESAAQFTALSGTPKFNSAGGMILPLVGNKVVWETPYWILGHTGFVNTAPVMSGGTVGNYRFYYEIDTGSGYSAISAQLTAAAFGTALSAISIPSTGFKLRLTIETTTGSTAAITFLTIATTSSDSVQTTQLYPLDVTTLTLTRLVSGSDVTILAAGTETVLDTKEENAGTTYGYTYETPQAIDIAVYQPGYIPFFIRNYSLGSSDASLPCAQVSDVSYLT